MTSDEIIKGFMICNGFTDLSCSDCPYFRGEGDPCRGRDPDCDVDEEFLKLFNRNMVTIIELQRKKSELEVELKAMRGAANSYKAENKRLKEENKSIRYCYEQAKSYNDRLAESCEKNCKKFNMTTRAEAIKEFVKMLEDISTERFVFEGYGENRVINIVEYGDIVNLAKKLTETDTSVSLVDGHIEAEKGR